MKDASVPLWTRPKAAPARFPPIRQSRQWILKSMKTPPFFQEFSTIGGIGGLARTQRTTWRDLLVLVRILGFIEG